jgi:nucleotide-binding universal stress UspA family protein
MLRLADRGVRVEIEHPGGARIPAVLLVHDGVELRGASLVRWEGCVRDLADRGFLVAMADYGPHDAAACGGIFAELLDRLERIANVDRERIGAVGIQRGATIALAVASLAPRFASLALESPAMPWSFDADQVDNLPRTLLVVGDRDVAAVATLNNLEALFRDRGRPYDVHVQKGVGPNPDETDRADAWTRILAFLEEYL